MLLKVISYHHPFISAAFVLSVSIKGLYQYCLYGISRFEYLIADYTKSSPTQQITIATLVLSPFIQWYIKFDLRYLYRSLWYDYRDLGYAYRDLGYDYRRLRYRYLSLFYLYRRLNLKYLIITITIFYNF